MAGFDYGLFDGGVFGALEAEGCLFDEQVFDGEIFDVCEEVELPPELVGGGSSRRRRKRYRHPDEAPLVPVVPEIFVSVPAEPALVNALQALAVPANTDVAMSSTAEIAMLIRKAQQQEDEAITLMLSEIL